MSTSMSVAVSSTRITEKRVLLIRGWPVEELGVPEGRPSGRYSRKCVSAAGGALKSREDAEICRNIIRFRN